MEKFLSIPNSNFTPIFLTSLISLIIDWRGILKFGIIYLTVPPGLSFLSKIVTSNPAFARKYPAESPDGPAPMIATFIPVAIVFSWNFFIKDR